MKHSKDLIILLQQLWQHIGLHRRKQFGLLLVFMLMTSFAEIFSIGMVLPFLSALTQPETVFNYLPIKPVLQRIGIIAAKDVLFPLTVIFCITAIFAGVMRLLMLWASTRLAYTTGADLSLSVYRRTLYQPYSLQCSRNSSEIINGISSKTAGAINVISHVLSIISSVVMMFFILVTLFFLNPSISLMAFGSFGLIYFFVMKLSRNRLITNSKRIAHESDRVIKALQEGLGGIRDVLIDGSQEVYCKIYRDADTPLRRAQGENIFIGLSPRFGIEALGMLLIAVFAYILTKSDGGVTAAIPILGAFALGAVRLLPILQQLYGSWAAIKGGQASLADTIDLLNQPLPPSIDQPLHMRLPFKREIALRAVQFRHSADSPFVLSNVNLVLAKGGRIGFIGATGSGKSTLMDLVMALLDPTNGVIEVDGCSITAINRRAWQMNIAHVPQSIFLADCSVEENIAFGVPKEQIDHERVLIASRQAQISKTIESWPDGYQTFVGERGIRLSGGQRQRIGIARALYKQANIIILDEATSALDGETEHAVMESIEELNEGLTVLIIAHRLTTLKNCTQIVELEGGGICRVGTYDDIIKKSDVKNFKL